MSTPYAGFPGSTINETTHPVRSHSNPPGRATGNTISDVPGTRKGSFTVIDSNLLHKIKKSVVLRKHIS